MYENSYLIIKKDREKKEERLFVESELTMFYTFVYRQNGNKEFSYLIKNL